MPVPRGAHSDRSAAWRARTALPAYLALALVTPLWVAPLQAATGDPDVVITPAMLEQGAVLSEGWRYHPGDDVSLSGPEVDDADWEVVCCPLRDTDRVPKDWRGVGWFRRRLALEEGMPPTAVAIRLEQAGASEIYLDGRLIARFGTVASTAADERPMFPKRFAAIGLEPSKTHVLAVRYSNLTGNRFHAGFRGFAVYLGSVARQSRGAIDWVLDVTTWGTVFLGIFVAIALLHMLLFVFHPRLKEYLFFALFSAVVALHIFLERQQGLVEDGLTGLTILKISAVTAVAVILSGLALEQVLFRRRFSPPTFVLGAAGLALIVWVWTWSSYRDIALAQVYFVLGFAEMLRIAMVEVLRRRREAWIVAAGFGALGLTVLVAHALRLAGVQLDDRAIFVLALLVLVVAFSAHLSRRVALTNRDLEARLVEVEALTSQTIAQERRAARDEAERRLLAAENERRAHELEEARRVQLAMLPAEPPRIEGFDIAFRMITATEVGGDYYDVVHDGDGQCVLAVGDATSHGLHAGMVVAVAKSLFQASGGRGGPAAVLHHVGAGLEAVRERRASMAMAVLRLEGKTLCVASAAMPPLLVLRRAIGSVEEVLLPGTPLGTLPGVSYREHTVDLATGDVVLVMTDGLVDAMDRVEQPFGYERVAGLLARMGGRSAAAIVDGMIEGVSSFLSGTPPQDDITVAAIAVA